MRLYKDLYVGASVRQKRYQMTWRLKHHKYQKDGYVIMLASNPEELIDIMPAFLLHQSYYRRKDLFILGIAGHKQEAMELVRQLIEKMYRETGDFRIREFVEKKEPEF